MQAVETPSVRSPSVGYWISLFLVPCIFLAIMAVVDRAPPDRPCAVAREIPCRGERLGAAAAVPQDVPAEDFAGYMDYTPVDANNVASVWYQVEVETPTAPQGLWAVYLP